MMDRREHAQLVANIATAIRRYADFVETLAVARPEQCDSRKTILNVVSANSGISTEDILSRKRTRSVCAARKAFCVSARDAGYSYQEMADFLGREVSDITHIINHGK